MFIDGMLGMLIEGMLKLKLKLKSNAAYAPAPRLKQRAIIRAKVPRNLRLIHNTVEPFLSLPTRGAWIEIPICLPP